MASRKRYRLDQVAAGGPYRLSPTFDRISRMLRRVLSVGLGFGGLVLCGLAVWSYCAPPAGPDLAVADSDIKISDCTVRQEIDVVFHLHNNSGRPIRVRRDSRWSVPEPELALVLSPDLRLVGFTIGDDVTNYYGFGFGFCALVLLMRDANVLIDTSNYVVILLSGAQFPVQALPRFLLPLALLLPLTYGLDLARSFLLGSETLLSRPAEIAILGLSMAVMVPAGYGVFHLVERSCRRSGTKCSPWLRPARSWSSTAAPCRPTW